MIVQTKALSHRKALSVVPASSIPTQHCESTISSVIAEGPGYLARGQSRPRRHGALGRRAELATLAPAREVAAVWAGGSVMLGRWQKPDSRKPKGPGPGRPGTGTRNRGRPRFRSCRRSHVPALRFGYHRSPKQRQSQGQQAAEP